MFESLITSHPQAFRQFSVDGEKILADVLFQLAENPQISSTLSLLHITNLLVGETPSKAQDRTAVLSAMSALIMSLKTQEFLFAAVMDTRLQPQTPGTWVWDALEAIITASFKLHEALIGPFEVACLLSISTISILKTISKAPTLRSSHYSDRLGTPIFNLLLQKSEAEIAAKENLSTSSISKWEVPLYRFLALLLTQDNSSRLMSPFTAKLGDAIEDAGCTILSVELATLSLKVLGKWVASGWSTPSIVGCSLIPFKRRVVVSAATNQRDNNESSSFGSRDGIAPYAGLRITTAEAQELGAGTTILIMCCGKGGDVTARLKMISPTIFEPTIRHYFGSTKPVSNLGSTSQTVLEVSELDDGGRTVVALLICFIHVSVYLQLCPLESFFQPLASHIAIKRISEKKFTELTRWQRNDARDEAIFESIKKILQHLGALNREEHETRHEVVKLWKEGYQTVLSLHRSKIYMLMEDPAYLQAKKDRDDCLVDTSVRLAEKLGVIRQLRQLVEDDRNVQLTDLAKKLDERLGKEKELYHNETDDIVWDADEKAQKELSHTAKLATISKGGEVKYQEISHVFEWRLRVCRSSEEALSVYERAKNSVSMVAEKLEERNRGRIPPILSTKAWGNAPTLNTPIEIQEQKEWLFLHDSTVEGQAIANLRCNCHEQFSLFYLETWIRGECQEQWERSSIELHWSFFSGLAPVGMRSQALRQQLQAISLSQDVLLSDWIGTKAAFGGRNFFSKLISPVNSLPSLLSTAKSPSRALLPEEPPVRRLQAPSGDSSALLRSFEEIEREMRERDAHWRRYFLETFALQVFHLTASSAIFLSRGYHFEFAESVVRSQLIQEANSNFADIQNQISQTPPSGMPYLTDAFNSLNESQMRPDSKIPTAFAPSTKIGTPPPFAPTIGRLFANRKVQKLDIFELEASRRKRIEGLFDISRFQMRSYLLSLSLQMRLLDPLAELEFQARTFLLERNHQEFTQLQRRKEWENRFEVPLFRLFEVERQERGALETDETISLNRVLVFRPRGKRYRPPRNDDTPIKIPLEPSVASRVRLWQRQILSSTFPMFAEVPEDLHVPTTKEALFGMATDAEMVNEMSESQDSSTRSSTTHSLTLLSNPKQSVFPQQKVSVKDVDLLSGAESDNGDRSEDSNIGLPRPLQQQSPAEYDQAPFVSRLRGEVTAIQIKKNEQLLGLLGKLEEVSRPEVLRQECADRFTLASAFNRFSLEKKALDVVIGFSGGDRGLSKRRSTVSAPGWRTRASSSTLSQ